MKETTNLNDRCLENERLRSCLQNGFDRAFSLDDAEELRREYRRARAFHREISEGESQVIDICSLVESVTVGCDILASPMGVSYLYCGNQVPFVRGREDLLTRALLNLLSNAYLYGTAGLVTVKTFVKGESAVISVLSGGEYDFIRLEREGIDYVKRVCKAHNGGFFVKSEISCSSANIILPLYYGTEKPKQKYNVEMMINDRLSPLYVELFGMEYH